MQHELWAQVNLRLISVDSTFENEQKEFKSPKEASDYIKTKHSGFIQEGYLAASIDSISIETNTVKAFLFKGERYQWANLSFEKVSPLIWNALNIQETEWRDKPLQPKRFLQLTEKILSYYENNGYPFAAIFLDSIRRSSGNGISARFNIESGHLIKIDSVLVIGDLEISPLFLMNHLGIHSGDLYDESKLKKITKKLQELSFLQQIKPWKLDFTIDKNKLYLYLKEKKANQLNGLLGLQPNTSETGGFLVTADFLLGLKNSLGYGETIDVVFQNLQYKSPRFNAAVLAPYLFGTPLGIEGSFDLLKKDTTFRKTSFEIGLRYQINSGDFIKIAYLNFNNRLITPDVNYVLKNKTLPENLDIQSHGVGLSAEFDRTDYRLNPQKGGSYKISVSGLIREVLPNDAFTTISDASGFDYESLYDTVNQSKYQYRIVGNLAYYFPLAKNLVAMLNYRGGFVSGHQLFQNELFQLGGFKILRGFDEQGIYANQYHIGTLELRFILGQNSFFYIFSDNAFVHTEFANIRKDDFPVSFGTGIALENKGGLFNIGLGLGKLSGERFEFKRARVHFGYVVYF